MASIRNTLVASICFLLLTTHYYVLAKSFPGAHRNKRQTSMCTCSNWSKWTRCLPDPKTTTTPATPAPTPTRGICYTPEIGAVAADVVFLIDESGSVGRGNFRKEMDFAECFANNTIVGPTMVQIGLLTFSWHAKNEFFLGDHRDKASLRSALRQIEYDGGSSYTGKGLRYARMESFRRRHGMRETAQHVLVVLTDGKSDNGSHAVTEAEELHRLGIKVFAVGIGNSIDRNELAAIASDSSKMYFVPNFDLLETVCSTLVWVMSQVDGHWTSWGSWTLCSTTCGSGTRIRQRTCTDPCPANGGETCAGDDTINEPCIMEECGTKLSVVDGKWANWGFWSPCTATCGCGSQYRERTCSNPSPSYGGQLCAGNDKETQNCGCDLCPRDGDWTEWNDWGTCSKTCGGGTTSRSRVCTNPSPANGGRECIGDSRDVRECFPDPCPVDGIYTAWGLWGACDRSCGVGARHRERFCSNPAPQNGGADCVGPSTNTEDCNTQQCPRNGAWGGWSNWGTCSVSCANGIHTRQRSCDSPAPAYGGQVCPGENSQTQVCTETECPIHGVWAEWGCWSPCSRTCGTGERSRERNCSNPCPAFGGRECPGATIQNGLCNTNPCEAPISTTQRPTTTTTQPPVDGNWERWSPWTTCGRSCGGGYRTRVRRCSNPPPSGAGKFCDGLNYEEQVCGDQPCPVDGGWGPWGGFSSCSASCGGGTKSRYHVCNNPDPANGGAGCTGDAEDTRICNSFPCPVNGNWGVWADWSTCTKTCNTGTQFKYRICDNPPPMYNGVNCIGDNKETINCETDPCPVHGGWSSWGAYGRCSVSCGVGQYSRLRSCNSPTPSFGGNNCIGDSTETDACLMNLCPVDGVWGSWSAWSQCTSTCDGGRQFRQRYCNNPVFAFGGLECPGDYNEFRDCASSACPVHGAWGQWDGWSTCSVTCNGGVRDRQRFCNSPAPSLQGDACVGDASERQSCNLQACPLNGAWSSWISSGCSSTCGGGILRRVRTCSNPAPVNNGLLCPGNDEETTSCNSQDCPRNGEFGGWEEWQACSVTCGRGMRKRERVCDSPTPLDGGIFCTGDSQEVEECINSECSVDGQFSIWSGWNECSRTCGRGVQFRYRTCTSPMPQGNGKRCAGDYWEVQDCSVQPCPTEAVPTTTPGVYVTTECAWHYADIVFLIENNCDSNIFDKELDLVRSIAQLFILGIDATQISVVSYRTLQATEHFDLKAYHDTEQLLNAIDKIQNQCAVRNTDAALRYVRTNSFTQLKGARRNAVKIVILVTSGVSINPSKTTQEAALLRQQNVKTIAVGVGVFSTTELRSVALNNEHVFTTSSANLLHTVRSALLNSLCSVDGQWSAWGSYGPCSVTCGDGYHYRTRLCDSPPRVGNGKGCEGDNFQVGYCFGANCPTTTTTSTTTTTPSPPPTTTTTTTTITTLEPTTTTMATLQPETCEGGTYFRRRNCQNPVLGAADCIGKEMCYYSSSSQCISVPPTTPPAVDLEPPALDNIPGCGSVPADIVFLLDKSTSVGRSSFRKMLRFVSRFSKSVSIGRDGVQISVVTFHNYARNEFNLNAYDDRHSLLGAIDAIPYDSGLTFTNLGLKYVRRESFNISAGMRENVAHIVVLLTEGASYLKVETLKESAKLRQANIKTIVIGIGANCDRAELEYIGDTMFEVKHIDGLTEIEFMMKRVVCEASNIWTLVMSVSRGQSVSPAVGVYDLWDGSYTMNENDEMARTLKLGSKVFKSSIVEMWSKFNFTAVRVSFFTDGMEKAYITFDARGSTKKSWFDCSRIINSTFINLKNNGGQRYCGIMGDESLHRRFFIHGAYTGCSSDMGWMAVVEGDTCAWEQRTDRPYFVYSSSDDKQKAADYDVADVFAVFVDIDYCSSQPCLNGGICEELPGNGYHCKCPTNYYGNNCEQQCETGTYGAMCTKTCSNGCVGNKCIRLTGVCADGCVPGYIGEYCDEECSKGRHGIKCQEACSNQCLDSECNASDGKCKLGCVRGFRGVFCDTECVKGWHGDNCKLSCSAGCKDYDCDPVTGNCKAGCNAGLQGGFCDKEISVRAGSVKSKSTSSISGVKEVTSLNSTNSNNGHGEGEVDESRSSGISNRNIIIIAVASGCVFLTIVILVCVLVRRRSSRKATIPNRSITGHDNRTNINTSTPRDSLEEIEEFHM